MPGIFQGFMTGVQAGREERTDRARMRAGSLMAGRDYAGASEALYGAGDLEGGMGLQTAGRRQQIGERLQAGDVAGARGIPGLSMEEAQAINQYASNMDEQERKLAADKFQLYASIAVALRNVPEAQRAAEAQRIAPIIGLDPSKITPDMLSDAGLDAIVVRSMGASDYLKEERQRQKDAQDAGRPIVTPYGILMPQGSDMSSFGASPQGQVLDALPPGATIRPRPNQAPGNPGAERNQTPTVSFSTPAEAQTHIRRLVPGVTFTSGRRSPETNARVGGVVNSYHLGGRAWDLVPPAGTTMAQLAARMKAAGFRVLNEGDHVHVSW